MCKTHVLSISAAKVPFEKTTIERRQLRPDDLSIDIKFSGICHSDIHENEALSFGEDYYFSTLDPETFNMLACRFDLILNTVSASIDVDSYLPLLRVDGAPAVIDISTL